MPKHDTCMNCGAWVEDSHIAKDLHTKFHEDIDELIDWAQNVSKLFERCEPAFEPSLSRGNGLLGTESEGGKSPLGDISCAAVELQKGSYTQD